MRKNEYRGKRIDNNEFIYGYLIGDDVIVGKIIDFDDEYFNTEFWCKVIPETVGQFTGLHDKNGVEIYCGDIAKGSIQCGTNNAYGVGEVHWSDDYFGWLITITNDDCAMYEVSMNDIGELEVIGNIHEVKEN